MLLFAFFSFFWKVTILVGFFSFFLFFFSRPRDVVTIFPKSLSVRRVQTAPAESSDHVGTSWGECSSRGQSAHCRDQLSPVDSGSQTLSLSLSHKSIAQVKDSVGRDQQWWPFQRVFWQRAFLSLHNGDRSYGLCCLEKSGICGKHHKASKQITGIPEAYLQGRKTSDKASQESASVFLYLHLSRDETRLLLIRQQSKCQGAWVKVCWTFQLLHPSPRPSTPAERTASPRGLRCMHL